MELIDEKIQSVIDHVTEQTGEMDPDQLWEFYSMLYFRFRSKVDDLEDAQQEKDSADNM